MFWNCRGLGDCAEVEMSMHTQSESADDTMDVSFNRRWCTVIVSCSIDWRFLVCSLLTGEVSILTKIIYHFKIDSDFVK